eukprot:GSMAST32.ASY1.ANO1.2542.1 assembled CDS
MRPIVVLFLYLTTAITAEIIVTPKVDEKTKLAEKSEVLHANTEISIDPMRNDNPKSARYAYATIHYEGTNADDFYLLGVRTMHQSIKRSGTKYPFVVLVSPEVRQSTRDTLISDGAILKDVENVFNPFTGHVKKHFTKTLNKIHLWGMTEYDRVVYLDADNIVLENADELFQCGHFCAVYMNPINFHTGLLVLKPDKTILTQMLDDLRRPSTASYDGADQGFLSHFFAIIMDSNFVSPRYEAPRMRLPPWYNLNSFWFYEKGHWGHWKNPESGLTLCWPVPSFLKPWFWSSHIFMDHLWDLWNDVRMKIDHPYNTFSFLFSCGFSVFVYIAVDVVIRVLAYNRQENNVEYFNLPVTDLKGSSSSLSSRRRKLSHELKDMKSKRRKRLGLVERVSKTCGMHPALHNLFLNAVPTVVLTFVGALFLTNALISPIAPPQLAWPLWIFIDSACFCSVVNICRYKLHVRFHHSFFMYFIFLYQILYLTNN